jgi:uncharacterized SAM-binding protein YcdF (DUF218 family)
MTATRSRALATRPRVLGLGLAIALLLVAATCSCLVAGTFLAREDPLQPADAIFVLAGSPIERPLEAVDLYLEGMAPVIVLTRDVAEREQHLAAARGVDLPSRVDLARQLLAGLGVPDEAVLIPARLHDNTAEEAVTLRELAVEHRWQRVIVVSSAYHLRRTLLACRRELRGTGVELVARATRYDESTPDRWWRRRSDIRWVVSELTKLAAYALHFQP